jgi:hypothetical protein
MVARRDIIGPVRSKNRSIAREIAPSIRPASDGYAFGQSAGAVTIAGAASARSAAGSLARPGRPFKLRNDGPRLETTGLTLDVLSRALAKVISKRSGGNSGLADCVSDLVDAHYYIARSIKPGHACPLVPIDN